MLNLEYYSFAQAREISIKDMVNQLDKLDSNPDLYLIYRGFDSLEPFSFNYDKENERVTFTFDNEGDRVFSLSSKSDCDEVAHIWEDVQVFKCVTSEYKYNF